MTPAQLVKMVRKIRPETYVSVTMYTISYSCRSDNDPLSVEYSLCIQPALNGGEVGHYTGNSAQACAEQFQADVIKLMESLVEVECPVDCQCHSIVEDVDNPFIPSSSMR